MCPPRCTNAPAAAPCTPAPSPPHSAATPNSSSPNDLPAAEDPGCALPTPAPRPAEETRRLMALKVCANPGCPTLTATTRCPAHQREQERRRGTRQQRGYGPAHERTRRHGKSKCKPAASDARTRTASDPKTRSFTPVSRGTSDTPPTAPATGARTPRMQPQRRRKDSPPMTGPPERDPAKQLVTAKTLVARFRNPAHRVPRHERARPSHHGQRTRPHRATPRLRQGHTQWTQRAQGPRRPHRTHHTPHALRQPHSTPHDHPRPRPNPTQRGWGEGPPRPPSARTAGGGLRCATESKSCRAR